MYRHAPDRYNCPFCLIAGGGANHLTTQDDVVYRDEAATAFVPCAGWPNNPGHVIIIPNTHIENIYEMPQELAGHIHDIARQVALAFKTTYRCDGTSTRQHNEPAGNQDVFHYHVHVFPRYTGDDLYRLDRVWTSADERRPYVLLLRAALGWQPPP
jgi:histidine triad (HIT) family protein